MLSYYSGICVDNVRKTTRAIRNSAPEDYKERVAAVQSDRTL
jgi:hypothetical protein